jgi:hypothetical protein
MAGAYASLLMASAFRPDVCARILDALRMGGARDDAARYAGIVPGTLSSWLRDAHMLADEQPDHPKVLFAAQVEEAVTQVKMESIALVRQGARDRIAAGGQKVRDNWAAAAWWLERRYPTEFATRAHGVNPERAASMLGVLLDRVLADPRVGLTPAQRTSVAVALHEHLDDLGQEAAQIESPG